MKPFTKLFSSIISSSIWRTSNETRLVWVTMLAMADRNGEVWASVGGLADMARLTREQTLAALKELAAPDEDSRTKEHDGRRIREIDGGWALLNYAKYRDLGRTEDRREYYAQHKRQTRARNDVHTCPQLSTMSPIAEAEADTEAEREESAARAGSSQGREDEARALLEGLGAKTVKGGQDILDEWKAATKGLKRAGVETIFKEARPGIMWPSEFKRHREARGI